MNYLADNTVAWTEKMKSIRQLHDYHVLRGRMIAIFLWPALLSTIQIPKQLEAYKNFDKANIAQYKNTNKM